MYFLSNTGAKHTQLALQMAPVRRGVPLKIRLMGTTSIGIIVLWRHAGKLHQVGFENMQR